MLEPCARSIARSCVRQDGQPLTTISAPVARMFCAFVDPTPSESAGWVTQNDPAAPQQTSAPCISTYSMPGMERRISRGWLLMP